MSKITFGKQIDMVAEGVPQNGATLIAYHSGGGGYTAGSLLQKNSAGEISYVGGVGDPLGFTPENVANKQNSLAIDGTGTKYPTVDAVNAGVVKLTGNQSIAGDKTIKDAIILEQGADFQFQNSTFKTSFNSNTLTADRGINLPDKDGVVALISDITGGATNLDYIPSPTQGTVTSDTGSDATIPLADNTNAGLLEPSKYTVLENISGVNTGDQDLQSVLNVGGYAELDSGQSSVELLQGGVGERYTQFAIENSTFSIDKEGINFSQYDNILEKEAGINCKSGGLVIKYGDNNTNKLTELTFDNPISISLIKVPAKTIDGTYTLATLDDITIDIDPTIIEDSPNAVAGGAVFDALANTVKLTGNQSIAGNKTIKDAIILEQGADFQFQNSTFKTSFNSNTLTANRGINLPDKDGVVALISDITGSINGTVNYLPKFTSAGVLGNSQIFDNGTNVLVGTTTDNGVDKLQVNGSVLANNFIKSGGTSSQFLKADGSVDNTTYLPSSSFTGLTNNFIPKSNGTGGLVNSIIESTTATPIKIGNRFIVNSVVDYSNFLGYQAGQGATNAQYSNFLGYYVGNNATNAYHSNFLGTTAGQDATEAYYSNFLGYQAGQGAINAYHSNFLGTTAGQDATEAYYSNFLGNRAGQGATNASNSNFLGNRAGNNATEAYYSNFLGYYAGKTFTGNNVGANNIIIGTNISLPNATANAINLGGVIFGFNTNSDTSGNPKIVATATGRVSIGSATDNGVDKLQVNGTIAASPATTSSQVVVKSQLDAKANLASPAFTGTPTAPTAAPGTNTTQIATTAFVQGIRPYKVYTALLSQSGTSAPVATVLENTLGVTITWTRSMSGQYFGTASSPIFSTNKFFSSYGRTNIDTLIRLDYFSTTEVFLGTATITGASTTTFSDNLIINASIEIRVYN